MLEEWSKCLDSCKKEGEKKIEHKKRNNNAYIILNVIMLFPEW